MDSEQNHTSKREFQQNSKLGFFPDLLHAQYKCVFSFFVYFCFEVIISFSRLSTPLPVSHLIAKQTRNL